MLQARAQSIHRSLARKKGRDGLTRVRLDLDWAIRDADPALDQAIHDLRAMAGKTAREGEQFVTRKAIAHQRIRRQKRIAGRRWLRYPDRRAARAICAAMR